MTFSEALPYILVAIAALLLIWAFLYFATRKTAVVSRDTSDVLDEGAERAKRNQALIDAPTAVQKDIEAPVVAPEPEPQPVAETVPEPAPDPTPAPEPAPTPAPQPAPAPTPAPVPGTGEADDLRKIKGVGPKLVALLADQGVTRFEQIAAWTDADVERVDATLGRFSGRITRDQWIEQAKLLASGAETEFSAKFGQNG